MVESPLSINVKGIKRILVRLHSERVQLFWLRPNLRYHVIGMLILGGQNSCTIIYHIIHNLAELGHVVFYIVNAGFDSHHLGRVQRN